MIFYVFQKEEVIRRDSPYEQKVIRRDSPYESKVIQRDCPYGQLFIHRDTYLEIYIACLYD